MKTINSIIALISILLFCSSCKKETNYIYEVDDVTVSQVGGEKGSVKTTTEFISIVYSDLFSTNIPTGVLVNLQKAYEAFGDKKLIEDRIVRHFLDSTAVQVPSDAAMRANVPAFVDETIVKFFNKSPDAFEKYFISNIIQSNTDITPMMVYYACLTSDEYRYY